jgi:hypothetical protein
MQYRAESGKEAARKFTRTCAPVSGRPAGAKYTAQGRNFDRFLQDGRGDDEGSVGSDTVWVKRPHLVRLSRGKWGRIGNEG